ncbi:unnamed protein product [Prorocentrum cordatum]|uniref:PPM-type phosphatase domain-containing protein n=1 Tax=Prorocentrum cordatum TaxID=2364126 RepID=A0ABN9XFY7_9DINO|nr:unnamed protein product [Polarella glacialis]
MSRCLGDLMGHSDCGLSCEPEVKVLELSADDTALLICSDGVWEFITPDEAVGIVSEFEPAKAMAAAERLAKEAWDRWIREERRRRRGRHHGGVRPPENEVTHQDGARMTPPRRASIFSMFSTSSARSQR